MREGSPVNQAEELTTTSFPAHQLIEFHRSKALYQNSDLTVPIMILLNSNLCVLLCRSWLQVMASGELDKKKSQHPSVIDIFTREHRTADLSERGENTLSLPTSFDVTVTIPEEISREDEEDEANQKTFTK
ncbi:hypothetical protein DAPPUDRAFT_257052 [Daphnia pulex]|uniref:Uncharacterized protein n=1 Tax=Daphnia pulex TaxID=6669 RepID=E9HCQ1_DAPPU|nr:hypothetical protein DAPPUDRAFT_257052 [Daphnia pulex]|eukprot:EFX70479.1 hypothetical protein DAPPUDRAFT_257052 [Daphnia pulex]